MYLIYPEQIKLSKLETRLELKKKWTFNLRNFPSMSRNFPSIVKFLYLQTPVKMPSVDYMFISFNCGIRQCR
jgi:hypothetical protein